MKKHPIDFVVPWVNPNDPIWQEDFQTHSQKAGIYSDFSKRRYRDWGLFKYWFRGVEKYAPWVNKVHLITYGHYPEWLNLKHPKLNLVKHEDYIPSSFLPTFSANPIELNLHRIEGLSEHFVYFNDDIFIKAPLDSSWFFKNGVPCDAGIMTAFSGTGFQRMIINANVVINKHYNKKDVIRNNLFQWFNHKYGKQLARNFLLLSWKEFTGFYDYHLANAYLKSTFEELWNKEEELLFETSSRKFRHELDLTQAVFKGWQLANNNFVPIPKHMLGDYLRLGVDPLNRVTNSLESMKKPLICLNDHDPDNLDNVIEVLTNIFNQKFPKKSAFEV